mgnify:FL=1|jgi:hypothetical protein|tara:strand:- start:408 stop:656 length:249 start_codon:yes stop_codon:yes gene_type:complete
MAFIIKILRKIRSWLLPKHDGEFEYSPEGFTKARRWAKNQPHPHLPDHPARSLWDYVSGNWIDSEYKLNEINKVKTNKNKTI